MTRYAPEPVTGGRGLCRHVRVGLRSEHEPDPQQGADEQVLVRPGDRVGHEDGQQSEREEANELRKISQARQAQPNTAATRSALAIFTAVAPPARAIHGVR